MSDPDHRPDAPETTGAAERQPEALATFAAAAKSPDKISPNGGLSQTQGTEALPADPEQKADAAARRLREGVFDADQGAQEAINRLPDRTRTDQG